MRKAETTGLRLFVFLAIMPALAACSLMATRPVQEMSDTAAAIKAAKEVQADVLAPELYRQSNEWFFKARKEYKLKNFALARGDAHKARIFAEQAEFESMRNGGIRSSDMNIPDPLANTMPGADAGASPSDQGTQQGNLPKPQYEAQPTSMSYDDYLKTQQKGSSPAPAPTTAPPTPPSGHP